MFLFKCRHVCVKFYIYLSTYFHLKGLYIFFNIVLFCNIILLIISMEIIGEYKNLQGYKTFLSGIFL